MFARILFAVIAIGLGSPFAAEPAFAQASCAAKAARVAKRPNLRVVSVQERGRACHIRVVEERPGRLPRSYVVVVKR